MPERDRLVAAEPDGAPGVDVVEGAGEGDDPDPHCALLGGDSATEWSSTCTSKSSITGLESRVSAICADLGEHVVGDLTLDLELEPLALPDVGHAVEPQPGQGAEDGLALGVEDLGLGHDVDDDTGHGGLLGGGRSALDCAPASLSATGAVRIGVCPNSTRNVPGLALEFPQSLAVYDDYAAAQKAVDFLADHHFPVQNCMIVGTELKQVERITGRLTTGRVALPAPCPGCGSACSSG